MPGVLCKILYLPYPQRKGSSSISSVAFVLPYSREALRAENRGEAQLVQILYFKDYRTDIRQCQANSSCM